MYDMRINKRKSISNDLKIYDPCAKDDDFIEITKWSNGTGYDICINDTKQISLSFDELEAIKHLILCLKYGTDKIEN